MPTLLSAQLFYAYPQAFFGPVGTYSLRFSHTAYIFEDDLDRLFYPVYLHTIKGKRFFLVLRNLSSPVASSYIPDNDITFGAKTELPLKLSFLYSGKGTGTEDVLSSDTTYSISGFLKGSGDTSSYFMEISLKDSSYYSTRSSSHSFLLSGGGEKFGLFFLISSQSVKIYDRGDTSHPFGNFAHSRKVIDKTSGNVLLEENARGYSVRDSLYRPIIGGISFKAGGRFTAIAFGGIVSQETSDSSGYSLDKDTSDPDRFVGEKVAGSRKVYEKSTPWLLGFQGDYHFEAFSSSFTLTLLYVFKDLGQGEGVSTSTSYHGWWDTLDNPVFSTADTSYTRFTYTEASHEFGTFLKGKRAFGERVKLGFGFGFKLTYENRKYDTINVLSTSSIFRDADGSGSVDNPADFRNTDRTTLSYSLTRETTTFSYFIPVGFEVQPFESLSGFHIRAGTVFGGNRTSVTEESGNFSAKSERIEEMYGDTLILPKDVATPNQYVKRVKSTTSPYPLFYGLSWKVGDRFILDITGVGYGISFPYIWALSLTVTM